MRSTRPLSPSWKPTGTTRSWLLCTANCRRPSPRSCTRWAHTLPSAPAPGPWQAQLTLALLSPLQSSGWEVSAHLLLGPPGRLVSSGQGPPGGAGGALLLLGHRGSVGGDAPPLLPLRSPPPCPRSPGQPVTHPAGSSPETPLPQAGPWSLPGRGGGASDSLPLFFLSLSLCVSRSLCLHLSLSLSLSLITLSVSLTVSPTSPRISAPHCHLVFPLSLLSPTWVYF